MLRLSEAATTSLERRKLWPNNPDEIYDVAGELPRCASLVGKDKPQLTSATLAERQKYADLAMEMLGQAVAAGYRDSAHARKDPDLQALRRRPDFEKLLTELEKSSAPGKVTPKK